MAFGGLDKRPRAEPMADINMTPLIDVMLVLVVILLITAPLLTHAIPLDLPAVDAPAAPAQGEVVNVSIDAAGHTYWNGQKIDAGQLRARLDAAAHAAPPAEIAVPADRDSRYQGIAALMNAARQAGIERLRFVTQGR